MGKKDGKPKGKMSGYAFFVQTCREEHKKKHPGEPVVFAEFSRKCASKWKGMGAKEKKRFEDMAAKDKERWERDMQNYVPAPGEKGKRKRTKDPNAPKRALSAFFFFCNDERSSVKGKFPDYGVGDIAKELGKRWGVCQEKPKFEAMAIKDKARYAKAMEAYKKGVAPAASSAKKAKTSVAKKPAPPADDDDDDDEDDDEEEDDDEDDDE